MAVGIKAAWFGLGAMDWHISVIQHCADGHFFTGLKSSRQSGSRLVTHRCQGWLIHGGSIALAPVSLCQQCQSP